MKFNGLGANSNSSSVVTRNNRFCAEAEFDAVRIHAFHYGTTTPTWKFAVAATETAAIDTAVNRAQPIVGGAAQNVIDSTSTPYGWRTLTFAGASSISFTGVGASATTPEIVTSDWVPISSVPRVDSGETLPLCMIVGRPTNADTQTASWVSSSAGQALAMRTRSAANRGRILQSSQTATDTIAAPGTGTAFGLVNDSMPIAVEFRYRTRAVGVLFIGDSITQNDALVADKFSSWGHRACAIASTPTRPVVNCNMGASGQTSVVYLREAKRMMAIAQFKAAVYSCWSPNESPAYTTDLITSLNIQGLSGRVMEFIAACRQYSITPILTTGIPYSNGLTASEDALRKAYNTRIRAMAPAMGCGLIDFDLLLSDGGSPASIITAYSYGDGIHPNEAGIEAMGILAAFELAKSI